jgi:hypothetical protein
LLIEWREIDTPLPVCKAIPSKPKEWGLRELRRIATVPVLRLDDTVLAEPGYDASTKILLVGGGFVPVPNYPTQQELRRAAQVLWTPFELFPFNEKSDAGALLVCGPSAAASRLAAMSLAQPSISAFHPNKTPLTLGSTKLP